MKVKKPLAVWAISIDGIIQANAYTALKDACNSCGASYSMATKGERLFIVDGKVIRLSIVTVRKVIGRGNASNLPS